MSHVSLSNEEYQEIAAEKGLMLVGYAPPSVYDKARWECQHCGKVHVKTYRAVKYGSFGCSCQNNLTLSTNQYHSLADRLGIEWIGKRTPHNTKDLTQWRGPSGRIVTCSYYQLAYRGPSRALQAQLGL